MCIYCNCLLHMLANLGECLSSVMQGAMYIVAFHKTNGNCWCEYFPLATKLGITVAISTTIHHSLSHPWGIFQSLVVPLTCVAWALVSIHARLLNSCLAISGVSVLCCQMWLCINLLLKSFLYRESTDFITYSDFINKELILFSNMDNERSIPSMVDGEF